MAQNETNKWYFGNKAGLDFSTNPPTALTNGSMTAIEGCASISNSAGNLLFYTDGGAVWDQTHANMANGTGLVGNLSSQSSIIIKKPGSPSLYYIFTNGWNTGINYSIVDMSLAAGNGSVTSKNISLSTNSVLTSGKLAAVKHCNGSDIWVVTREFGGLNNPVFNFHAYLITSAGVNTLAVISPGHPVNLQNVLLDWGCMKISPNGKKIGLALPSVASSTVNLNYWTFELYDFNALTGAITNSLALTSTNLSSYIGYGCEFSPDCSKFYGSYPYTTLDYPGILQWDLCAGSNAAIVASQYTVATANLSGIGGMYSSMQIGPDGKIYIARYGSSTLSVINSPNLTGSACNYSAAGQSISPKTSYYGLPNFISSFFYQPPLVPPFTYTVDPLSCLTVSFTAPPNPSLTCAASGYSFSNLLWLFGDPASGAANTSTLNAPVHIYSAPGSYTTKLIYYTTCGSDTISLPLNLSGPTLTITSSSISCASLGSATVNAGGGIGPYSYTWTPTAQTTSVVTGLYPGNYSVTVLDYGGSCTVTATIGFIPPVPFTGTLASSPSVTCNGVNNGTASIAVSGGSGNNIFSWIGNANTQTTALATGLGAGSYTVVVTDALTFCSLTQSFVIAEPPPATMTIAASASTVCAGGSILFTASNSWGLLGPYTYTWSGGITTNTFVASSAMSGSFIYTVNSRDGNNCLASQTVAANFILNPILNVTTVSVCPLETASLIASGASSYTWSPSGSFGNILTANPLSTTLYTVIGSALGCTSAPATTTIFVKPIPSPTITSNSPICNGENLTMSASSASSYTWTGPMGFSSFLQNAAIVQATPNNAGGYVLNVTAVNGCSASATSTLTVNPTPTVSASGSTVCSNQLLNLFSNTVPGATFLWSGPNSFSSSVQNPTIQSSQATTLTGVYNLTVTSQQSCTNTASANTNVVELPIPVITPNFPSLCFGSNLTMSGSGGDSYSWVGPNNFVGNQPTVAINNVSLPAGGIYTLIVSTGPCVNSATQSIVIHPLPTPTAGSASACQTNSIQLIANGGGGTSFAWSGPLSFTSSAQNPVIYNLSPANAGFYDLRVTDGNNCEGTTSATLAVLTYPVIQTNGAKVCFGSQAVLTASGAATYFWVGPNNYYSAGAAASVGIANSTSPQSFTVIGTGANSCTNTSIAILETTGLPSPSLIVTPETCVNSNINLQGFGGITYAWAGPNGFFSTKQSVSFVATDLSYKVTYTLTVADSIGCKNFTTANVIINPAPEGDLSGTNADFCVPFCSNFTLKTKDASPVINLSWQLNNQVFNTPELKYCANQPGNYILSGTFTNAIGCVNTETIELKVFPQPVANFEFAPQNPIASLDEVFFTNTSAGEQINKWNWYFINNNGYKTDSKDASYLFENAGAFPVSMVVTNQWGCADTIVKKIVVENDFVIYVPNSFTPNDDNNNDQFFAKGLGIVNYDLSIFDRWGEKIFETNDFTKSWDGTFKGKDCKTDVYIWKIKAGGLNGKTKYLQGHVTLYR
jgi:gliding motility-associated-like protein